MVWLAAHTRSGQERLARDNVERDGHEAYLPLCRDLDSREVEPLFPRYFFVRRDDRWFSLKTTIGVRSIVRRGSEPDHMPDEIVDELRSREDELGLVRLDDHELPTGCGVRVAGGPLLGRLGVYTGVSRNRRCDVMFNMLGANRVVSVPREYLRVA
jgi:transcriptional antiterminator RfaH